MPKWVVAGHVQRDVLREEERSGLHPEGLWLALKGRKGIGVGRALHLNFMVNDGKVSRRLPAWGGGRKWVYRQKGGVPKEER